MDAANAYKNIVNATNDARNASRLALKAAEETNKLIDGLDDRSTEAENTSMVLLQEAQKLNNRLEELRPTLTASADSLNDIKETTEQNDADIKQIDDALSRLGEKNYEDDSEHNIQISDLGIL